MLDALIDSHCHLNFKARDGEPEPKPYSTLISEGQASGVSHFVNICTELKDISSLEEISNAFPDVVHTIGIHPHEAKTISKSDLTILEHASLKPKCRAIGEIGLDYYYLHSDRESQIEKLEWQLELALRVSKPIVIHSRDGESDLLPLLKTYSQSLKQGQLPGVIHCFTGTRAFGEACIELGFFISFSGILTFKSAKDLQECARAFPLESLMVETDSPFLAPIPFRGKRCEPRMVRETATKLAELKGTSFQEVAQKTTANSRRLFNL